MTDVFISWSGEKSKDIAAELHDWLPTVLQFARPYFTPNDIEKGAKWNGEISKKLSDCDVGIVCLTPENLSAPWILFEAGALSKNLEQSRLTSALFQLDPSDVVGPLASFQNTSFTKVDFRKLVGMVNAAGGEAQLDKGVLDRVFDKWWPDLETKIAIILGNSKTPEQVIRRDRDLLEEVLDLTRVIAKTTPSNNRIPSIRGPLRDIEISAENIAEFISDHPILHEEHEQHPLRSPLRRIEMALRYLRRLEQSPIRRSFRDEELEKS